MVLESASGGVLTRTLDLKGSGVNPISLERGMKRSLC